MASYFVRSEQSRPVALPDAQQGAVDDQASQNRLTITIEQDGRYSIGGRILPEATVFRRIQELTADAEENGVKEPAPEVRIRSDRDTHFVEIRKIIEQCASHNIRSIKFAVASRKQ
jgi:biopolymer transport protein ExbD